MLKARLKRKENCVYILCITLNLLIGNIRANISSIRRDPHPSFCLCNGASYTGTHRVRIVVVVVVVVAAAAAAVAVVAHRNKTKTVLHFRQHPSA